MKKAILSLALVFTAVILPAQNAATQIVTGTIVGPDGEALIGASIAVAGKSTGTISDVNGTFRIAVANEDALRISYLGYQTVELYPEEIEYELKGRIELKDGMWLNEVVITAKRVEVKSITTHCCLCTNVDGCLCSNADSSNVYSSLQISTKTRPWQYYPNPTTDGVTVVTEAATGFINVFSSDGKLVVHQSVTDVQTRVDMMGLSAGMYFMRYENDDWAQAIGKVLLIRS